MQQQKKFRPVPIGEFVEGDVAEPRWAVRNVWPAGASGIIAGRPKDRKSTLAAELGISLWSGTDMFGLPEFDVMQEPAAVLYVQQENSNSRVQRDLQRIMEARGLGHFDEAEPVAVGQGADGKPIYERHLSFVSTPEQHDNFVLAGTDPPAFEIVSHGGFDLSAEEDMDWLWARVAEVGYRYVFLDPLYMLIGAVDEKDSAPLRPILTWLTRMKNELGCATVLTHHMSDKGGGNEAATMLGSTYIHGWYECALFTRHLGKNVLEVKVDAQRDFGTEEKYILDGRGVGHWRYHEGAQDREDSAGRSSPNAAKKAIQIERFVELQNEHGENGWTDEQYGEELGVSARTIRTYRREAMLGFTPSNVADSDAGGDGDGEVD